MKEFHIPSSFSTARSLPNYFYNTPEYIGLVGNDSTFSFYLYSSSEQVIARVHFQINEGKAQSHWRAPFGGLETAMVDREALIPFWIQIEQRLKEEGAKEIQLFLWPHIYDVSSSYFLRAFFLENGFQLLYTDSDFYVSIGQGGVSTFLKPERKRLRKCKRHGLIASQWLQPNVREVYDLLLCFRQQRNIPLNISKEQLIRSFQAFPEKYQVFVVKDNGKVIGVSVCVEVNPKILYHFCLACDADYHLFSPSVMLYDYIYFYCQQKGFHYFDFGVASIKGRKQEGLYQFKVNLGGIVSEKPVFEKKLG